MRFLQNRFARILITLAVCQTLACGGGGGGSDNDDAGGGAVTADNVTFQGTLSDTVEARAARAVPDVTICALGVCDVSDQAGVWGFQVPRASFPGGNVSFDFNSPTLDTSTTVVDLRSDVRTVNIAFVMQPDGQVQAVSVDQDGTGSDVDPGINEPEEDACAAIRNAEVVIDQATTPVVVRNSDPNCPVRLSNLISVRTSGSIAFTYELLPERPEVLSFEPSGDTLNPGERQSHDGVYLCNASETFTQTITARIVRYIPADGIPITADEALEICGSGAPVGNTTDSVQIAFQVNP